GKGKLLTRTPKFLLVALVAGTIAAAAQTPQGAVASDDRGAADPVAQVRSQKSWEYGPFVNWGSGVGNRSDYKFLWGGFELGKVLTPVVHAGIFSGQFQYGGNIMPLWQAYTPAPHP